MGKKNLTNIKGGNTNLYKTRIKPRKIIRGTKKTKQQNRRGGGIFSFLSKGLSSISKKIPSSIKKIAQEAVRKGAHIAKRELQKPKVQKAIKSAIRNGSKIVVDRALQKATSGNLSPQLIPSREGRTIKSRRKNRKRKNRVLFQTE